jgi:serine/threonine protein kinase
MTQFGTGLEERDDKETDRVKICDFTVALELTRDEVRVNDKLGTLFFLAPEVYLQESYQVKPLDIWALGVTLYAYLMSGSLPYMKETEVLTSKSIIKDMIDFESLTTSSGEKLSPSCIDLLKGLLEKDPTKRLTIDQVLLHEWHLV